MTKNQPNLTTEIFPNPELRGIVMLPVCWDLELHIWRLLLDHMVSGIPLTTEETTMLGFQDRQLYSNTTFHLKNSEHKSQKVAIKGDTPGVITHKFPNDGTHIMRGILGNTKRLNKTRMLESLQKRKISEEQQAIIIPEIMKTDDLWFTSVFLTMLTQVGVSLSVKEREQLIVNIEWFAQNYQE
jgi:hypothetical protein